MAPAETHDAIDHALEDIQWMRCAGGLCHGVQRFGSVVDKIICDRGWVPFQQRRRSVFCYDV